MSLNPTVLKIGPSVITGKEKSFAANLSAIRRLVKEISEANVSQLINGIPVLIMNAAKTNNLYKALKGEKIGTFIEKT